MRDLSLHLLDLAENSLRADASLISLALSLQDDGALDVVLDDDGRGMEQSFAQRAADPFATTRTTRKVGLGLPLAAANAEKTGGFLRLDSLPGQGTRVHLRLMTRHVDCLPLGDLPETMSTLVLTHPDRPDFVLALRSPQAESRFDTRDIRRALGPEVGLQEPEVMDYIKQLLIEQCQTVFGGLIL